jgi:hypothetical protein
MSVEFISKKITAFRERLETEKSPLEFSFEISEPWYFKDRKELRIPYGDQCGVYIFTAPPDSSDMRAEGMDAKVWYVGKSVPAMGGRIWKHMGPVLDPDSGEECAPPFKHHRWRDCKVVPDKIRDKLANGNVVIYTIPLETTECSIDVAEMLEKYLLIEYALCYQSLPVLNLSF